MGALQNVRFCARGRSDMTESGRKRNDRFGGARPEKRTASYRPNNVVKADFCNPRKQSFAVWTIWCVTEAVLRNHLSLEAPVLLIGFEMLPYFQNDRRLNCRPAWNHGRQARPIRLRSAEDLGLGCATSHSKAHLSQLFQGLPAPFRQADPNAESGRSARTNAAGPTERLLGRGQPGPAAAGGLGGPSLW